MIERVYDILFVVVLGVVNKMRHQAIFYFKSRLRPINIIHCIPKNACKINARISPQKEAVIEVKLQTIFY